MTLEPKTAASVVDPDNGGLARACAGPTDTPMTSPIEVFRTEFIEKRLVLFDECRAHYQKLDLSRILAEVRFLIRDPVESMPFALTGRRFYALMTSTIEYAANRRGIDKLTRSKLVGLCIDLIAFARRKTHPDSREALDKAIQASLDTVERFGRYRKVAELIAREMRDYKGEFAESPAGILRWPGRVPAEARSESHQPAVFAQGGRPVRLIHHRPKR
jgi:hypothetical protein